MYTVHSEVPSSLEAWLAAFVANMPLPHVDPMLLATQRSSKAAERLRNVFSGAVAGRPVLAAFSLVSIFFFGGERTPAPLVVSD